MLADTGGLDEIVAEIDQLTVEDVTQLRVSRLAINAWTGVEVQAQAQRKRVFLLQLQHRPMVGHAEVLRRTPLLRSEHRMHRSQPHAVEIPEHLLHRPLGVGERPVGAQRIERVPRRPVHRNRASLGHRHALAFEELPAQRIRRRRAVERDVDVDRMSRRCGVELGQRRQPVLGELPRLEAADGGDECALRHTLRTLANHVLDLGD